MYIYHRGRSNNFFRNELAGEKFEVKPQILHMGKQVK